MNTKSLFQSKTFWIATVQFIVGLLALVSTSFGAYIPASVLGVIVMVKSVIDMYLRTLVNTEVTSIV